MCYISYTWIHFGKIARLFNIDIFHLLLGFYLHVSRTYTYSTSVYVNVLLSVSWIHSKQTIQREHCITSCYRSCIGVLMWCWSLFYMHLKRYVVFSNIVVYVYWIWKHIYVIGFFFFSFRAGVLLIIIGDVCESIEHIVIEIGIRADSFFFFLLLFSVLSFSVLVLLHSHVLSFMFRLLNIHRWLVFLVVILYRSVFLLLRKCIVLCKEKNVLRI